MCFGQSIGKNGVFALGNAEFIAGLKELHDKENAIKADKAMKKKMNLVANANKVNTARKKWASVNSQFQKISMDDC